MTDVKMKYGFPLFVREQDFKLFGSNTDEKIVVVDIFAFWYSLIKDKYDQNPKQNTLFALLEQSKNFYLAAESSPIKSKPLLYYYSFLNFAKIIIIIEKNYSNVSYLHGVSHKIANNSFKDSIIEIQKKECDSNSGVNVATVLINILEKHDFLDVLKEVPVIEAELNDVISIMKNGNINCCVDIEFCLSTLKNYKTNINYHLIHRIITILEDYIVCINKTGNCPIARKKIKGIINRCGVLKNSFTKPTKLNVKDMLANCIGVHRPYRKIYPSAETFFRLDGAKLFFDNSKLTFKAEIKDCDTQSIKVKEYYDIIEDKYLTVEISIVEQIDPDNIDRKYYYALSQEIRKKGVWYSIKNNEYTMYISSNPKHRYTPETIIYATMFYFGSITRYAPDKFESIFSGTEQWLMSEFLSTQPKQFLYSLTSIIIGQETLKSYASF